MSVVWYMVIGYVVGELIHLTVWEFFKNKFNLNISKVKSLFIFIGISVLIAMVSSGFYRVKTAENVVLTSITGNRQVKDNVGVKYSLFSSTRPVDLRKQTMAFPSNTEYQPIVTKKDKVVNVAAILEYKVKDVAKFAIQNKETKDKLYKLMVAKVVEKVRGNDYEELIRRKQEFEQEIEKVLQDTEYGVEILDFYFLSIIDSNDVRVAKSNSEALRVTSEAQREVNRLLKKSLDEYTVEQLDYLKTKMMVEEGNIKWAVTDGGLIVNG